MTKKIQVCIGANYGDEGKGRTTAWLAAKSKQKVAVVRFNGGAQAGHTVKSGHYRHVFSHFGSGSFDYVPTILTKDFVCSPYLFMKEHEQLICKGVIRPDVYIDPRCPITTPWDMMLNQLVEESRGSRRHGSVGVGFGETIERHEYGSPEFQLTVGDILHRPTLCMKISAILGEYLPMRMGQLGIDEADFGNLRHVFHRYELECRAFLERVIVLPEEEALNKFDHLVFEGAQGLALDQEAPDFPHVTRSFTGVDNVLRVLEAAEIHDPLHMVYVTRPYFTRHGAGPLDREIDAKGFSKLFNVVDETNKPHDFQGTLRFSTHDLDYMSVRVIKDQFKIPREKIGKISLMITCLDQIVGDLGFPAIADGRPYTFTEKSFAAELASRINASHIVLCHGEDDWAITEARLVSSRKIEHVYEDEEDGC